MHSKEVKQIVGKLYSLYGKELFSDKSRLKAFLADYLVTFPLEYNLITNAVDCGICYKLAHGEDNDSDLRYYVQLLSDSYGTGTKQSEETVKILEYAINGKEAVFSNGNEISGSSGTGSSSGSNTSGGGKKRAPGSPWLAIMAVSLVVIALVLVLRSCGNASNNHNSNNAGSSVTTAPTVTSRPISTPKPTAPPTVAPTAVPTPQPTPTPKTPGPDDIKGCNEQVVYPNSGSWLTSYETKYVKTKHGVRAYLRYEPSSDSGYYSYVYERDAVTVLARQNGFSLVKTTDGMAGWVTSSVLVDNY